MTYDKYGQTYGYRSDSELTIQSKATRHEAGHPVTATISTEWDDGDRTRTGIRLDLPGLGGMVDVNVAKLPGGCAVSIDIRGTLERDAVLAALEQALAGVRAALAGGGR